MRKTTLAQIALIVISASFTTTSCKKEVTDQKIQSTTETSKRPKNSLYEVNSGDSELSFYTAQFKSFVEAAENNQVIDEMNGLTYEESEFLVEGVLNYKFGNVFCASEEVEIKETEHTINVDPSGHTHFEDLKELYLKISEEIILFYNSSNFENKSIYMVDLELKNIEQLPNLKVITARIFMKKGGLVPPLPTLRWASFDYYHKRNTGRCDGTADAGATKIIEDLGNYNMSILSGAAAAPAGYRVYSINIKRERPLFWFSVLTATSPSSDPKVKSADIYAREDDGTGLPCLSMALINYYVSKVPSVINAVTPGGKRYLFFENGGGYETLPNDNHVEWEDNYQITFGKDQITTDPGAL